MRWIFRPSSIVKGRTNTSGGRATTTSRFAGAASFTGSPVEINYPVNVPGRAISHHDRHATARRGERLMAAPQWQAGDPEILIVAGAGYDGAGLAWLLRDLLYRILARMRSDRVLRRPAPVRLAGPRPTTAPWRRVRLRRSLQLGCSAGDHDDRHQPVWAGPHPRRRIGCIRG
ncbi:transposase [Nonomuraea sp. KM90]|uniref:transposase n=1 Tax=Nonomuraea sp. KM90 TaxID=3457428 RepID=UPI003FCDB572